MRTPPCVSSGKGKQGAKEENSYNGTVETALQSSVRLGRGTRLSGTRVRISHTRNERLAVCKVCYTALCVPREVQQSVVAVVDSPRPVSLSLSLACIHTYARIDIFSVSHVAVLSPCSLKGEISAYTSMLAFVGCPSSSRMCSM